jgi:hypothetical protein
MVFLLLTVEIEKSRSGKTSSWLNRSACLSGYSIASRIGLSKMLEEVF